MEKGDVVISKSGSDAGKAYVILEFAADRLVLADGKRHTISSPKKKNIRHVKPTGIKIEIPANDAMLVKIIERLNLC